ncbi:hypothetical protein AVEN_244364-1 [Araneus ventricosus]|uniref:Uncharacterized protein n=1 Tax=Araneus ventricosus TaxID=182803 RepID=A0A4Y2ILK0_ARAVE|nr:hypothetical protein AVEN_244364-1 [Araneus ventricosus]
MINATAVSRFLRILLRADREGLREGGVFHSIPQPFPDSHRTQEKTCLELIASASNVYIGSPDLVTASLRFDLISIAISGTAAFGKTAAANRPPPRHWI